MFGKMFILAIVSMAFATPMMAADPAVVITAAFSMSIASGLCALGQGKAIAGAVEAIARNPGAATAIRGLGLLGLVFIESLALFTLVIVFVKG